jgi:hydroxymethylglutaryl-CoA reductase (NADPH)
MSAIAAGQLVKSHMKYNRSSKDVTKIASWAVHMTNTTTVR